MNFVAPYSKLNILVAEDNDANYVYLHAVLSRINMQMYRAKNGLEAIDMVASNPHIDLVLMDIKMPELNGIEATKIIKQMHPNLPIIAQTAYFMQEEQQEALLAGCDGFLPKPIKKSDLMHYIEKYSRKNK